MDDYARKNHIENIAQVTVVALFDKVMPGGVGTVIPNSWQQVFHQYATVQWKLGDILIPGGTCRRRIVNSAPVATRRRRSLGPRPEVPPLSSSVQAIPEAPLPETVTVTLYDDAGNAFASETLTIPK